MATCSYCVSVYSNASCLNWGFVSSLFALLNVFARHLTVCHVLPIKAMRLDVGLALLSRAFLSHGSRTSVLVASGLLGRM